MYHFFNNTLGEEFGIAILIISIILYVIFRQVGGTAWFPILKDFVPSNERGRFFAVLRVSWQIIVWLWIIGVGFYIDEGAPLWKYQVILSIAIILNIGRTIFFLRLPEKIPNQKLKRRPIWIQIRRVLRERYFQRFTLYIAGLRFFTAFSIPLLALFMKDLHFPDNQNIMITSLYMLGSIAGYTLGGYLNDKIGSKPLFKVSQFGYIVFYNIDFLY